MSEPYMLFDLSLKDADLQQALQNFFTEAGRPFVFDDDVQDVITVHAADVGFHDALVLMLPTGYDAVEIEGIYHVRKMPQAA